MDGRDIIVYMDWVEILGQRIARPSSISRSAWLAYWERAANIGVR